MTVVFYDAYINDQSQTDQQTAQEPTSNRPATDQQPTTHEDSKDSKDSKEERENMGFSPDANGVHTDPSNALSLPSKNLSLDDDTPTNRWLTRYLSHRPSAGHPLGTLNATQIDDTRDRVADLIEWVGEERAGELLNQVFTQHPKPVSVKQALMRCQQLQEQSQKNQPTEPTPTAPSNGLTETDRRKWVFRFNRNPDTGDFLPDGMSEKEKEELVYATAGV